jgi:uracil-DNA glycosylase
LSNRLTRPLGQLLDADLGDWQPLLQAWRASNAGRALIEAVDARVEAGATVYPARVFRALELTPLARTRVVILGQDPYHGPGQAEGLAFSVPAGQRHPPSLRNIFKELQRSLAIPPPVSGSLVRWAGQGVMLLNASLTVEDGQAASHAKLGWHALTDSICEALSKDASPKVFMLWGAHAQGKAPLIAAARRPHRVLQANHPSPLSALRPPVPFIGCGHFAQANQFLSDAGRSAVAWAPA